MGLPEAPRLMDQQLVSGFMAMGALVSYWRGRSELSGSQLSAIAAYGLGQAGWLDSSMVSRIENARQARGCSLKNLLAFDAANQVIHAWQTQGQQAVWARWGPHTVWAVREQWLQESIWLPLADKPPAQCLAHSHRPRPTGGAQGAAAGLPDQGSRPPEPPDGPSDGQRTAEPR